MSVQIERRHALWFTNVEWRGGIAGSRYLGINRFDEGEIWTGLELNRKSFFVCAFTF